MKFRHNLEPGQELRMRANPDGGVVLTLTMHGEWMDTQRGDSFAMLVTGPMAPPPPRPKEEVIYVDFVTKERMP